MIVLIPFFLLTIYFVEVSRIQGIGTANSKTLIMALQTGDKTAIKRTVDLYDSEPQIFSFEIRDRDGLVVAEGGKKFFAPILFATEIPLKTATGISFGSLTLKWIVTWPLVGVVSFLLLISIGAVVLLGRRICNIFAAHVITSLSSLTLMFETKSEPSEIQIDEIREIYSRVSALRLAEIENAHFKENEKIGQAMLNLSKQVAHDIRSPLAALSMVTGSLKDLPEEKRLLIRNAVQRINDISNDLLSKSKPNPIISNNTSNDLKTTTTFTTEFIPVLVDVLVSEKRTQYRERFGVNIEVDFKNSFGAFSIVNGVELKRVLSNLINNSIESLNANQGQVTVAVRKTLDCIEISIEDNGKGIPQHILQKLGESGITYGKEGTQSGSGLGVSHAKQLVEAFSGKILFESTVGVGTIVTIQLPISPAPLWFADKVNLIGKRFLVSLDDDVSIHQIWSGRLKSLGANQIEHVKIQSGELFTNFVRSNHYKLDEFLFLVDFELLNQPKTGLDIIEDLGISKSAVLVTSRYEEKNILERSSKIGLKLLPKTLAGFVPILYQNRDNRNDVSLFSNV